MTERMYSEREHVFACHGEVAPVCAVLAADRGRQLNLVQVKEGKGRKVLMSGIIVTEREVSVPRTDRQRGGITEGRGPDRRAPSIKTTVALVYRSTSMGTCSDRVTDRGDAARAD